MSAPDTAGPPPIHPRRLPLPAGIMQFLDLALEHGWNLTVLCEDRSGTHLVSVRSERGAFRAEVCWAVRSEGSYRITEATVCLPGAGKRWSTLGSVKQLVVHPPVEWRLRGPAAECGLYAYPDGTGYTLHRSLTGNGPAPWTGADTIRHPDRVHAYQALVQLGQSLLDRGWETA